MRDWQWDEIVQHPARPLTVGQIELLRQENMAALSCERRAALCIRLVIEVTRLRAGIDEALNRIATLKQERDLARRAYSSQKLGPLD